MTSRWWRISLGLLVAALISIGGAGAVVLGLGGNDYPAAQSVDAGFSRDMSTHHRQAVLMAGLARDRSADSEVALIAYDIETTQLNQLGQMQGWLSMWGLSQSTGEPMSWMGGRGDMDMSGSGPGLMPGMASVEELDDLRAADAVDFDVLFLQLMIRHHQGGTQMASYAAEHAEVAAVETLARSIANAQAAEIETLTDMLTARGGTPLPVP
ncbi:MAG: DUF305 domain-containing protein [Geodermatophilaceae bacterium]|nr:DUF305 domain-containing protein [Geodermatophilaceae bacterium]